MDQNDDSYIAEYDELLHKLYLAIEGKGFDQFLLTIRETLGLASACLGVIDQAKKKTLYGFASGYPKGVLPLIIKSNGFVREDGVVRAFAKGPSCLFSYSEGNPNYNILTGLSFFTQKWVKASGIIDAAVISFMLNPRLRVVLIFNRHRLSGLIEQQELELLTRLKPHIEQACLLYDRVCRHQKNIANIQQLVNHLDYPVAIFSPLNDIISASQSFVKIGQTYQLWHYENEELSYANDAIANTMLEYSFIEQIEDKGLSLCFWPTDNLPLRFSFKLIPSASFQQDLVMLEIYDPNRQPRLSLNQLETTLGLSLSEAKICLSLMNGLSTVEVAEHCKLSLHTVRDYIKEICSRLHVKRQNDLIIKLIDLEIGLKHR